jgi:RNA polymerase sigma factor (sigma-70 family)
MIEVADGRGAEPFAGGDLIQELYKFARDYARASASQQTEADDYLQEILITFLEVAHRYKVPKSELLVIARTAARNRIRDLVKHRNVRFKYHVSLEDAGGSISYDEDALRVAKDLIEHIGRYTTNKTRQVMEFIKAGNTADEIAKMLDVPTKTVYKHIQEAKMTAEINFADGE